MNNNEVEMELSDTEYKTRPINLTFKKPQKFKLYMILNVSYDVKQRENQDSGER